MKRFSLVLVCFSAWPLTALAQETFPEAPSPQLVSPQKSAKEKPEGTDKTQQTGSAQDAFKAEDKQRALGIVSTRNVVLSGHADPLTNRQKFTLWMHSAIDPFTFVSTGLTAAIEQANDSYTDYGQGAAGFGKRFGAAYADTVDGHLWGRAILPSILHQDPRYFRAGQGTIKHRTLYSIEAVARCKGDNGHWQFAASNIAGNLIGGAIANVYYPPADRGIKLVLDRGLIVTAEGAIGNLFSEFYPDAIAHFRKKKTSP